MATGDFQKKLDGVTAVGITIASLGNNTTRGSDRITNSSDRPGALINVKFKVGNSPNNGGIIIVLLLRENDNIDGDDGWTGVDGLLGGFQNAAVLGVLTSTGTAQENLEATFDTMKHGYLGPRWGIGVRNEVGGTLNANASNHAVDATPYYFHEEP